VPWIKTIDKTEATAYIKELYDEITRKRGKVSNIMKVQCLNPHALKQHLDLYMTLMFGKCGLSRAERELIAVVVSAANECRYCITHHAEALKNYWKDDEKVRKAIESSETLDLSEKTQRMIYYVIKMTKTPGQITQDDIDALRDTGYSDEDILNINLIMSYFNFVNRIALGLGVEYSDEEAKGYKI
jgi:uncharacterized peroxidase-related enzyme